MCPPMQMLAGSPYTKYFKRGLCKMCGTHIHSSLGKCDAALHVPSEWMWGG